jgi:hypothetical protein
MPRPSKYKPECIEQVKKLCLLGFTNAQIEEYFEISHFAFQTWRKKYPEFDAAIKEGKTIADGNVAESLYQKAMGGDTTACIFWLKNRQPTMWKDRRENNVTVGEFNATDEFL